MAKVLRSRDVGFDCDAVVHAETDDEILAQAAQHVTRDHGLEHVGDDVVKKVLASIRTE